MNDEYGLSVSFGSIVRPNIVDITHIQVEEVIYVQNQHQYMDQLINLV